MAAEEKLAHARVGQKRLGAVVHPFVSFGQACPDLFDRTVIVNGVAKALCDDRLAHRLYRGPRLLGGGGG